MPRRRLDVGVGEAIVQLLTGLSPMAAQGALTIANHAHKQRTSHIDNLNKSHLVKFEHIKGRRGEHRKYKKRVKRVQGTPVDLSLGGGELTTKTFLSKNKILDKSKAMPYRRRSYPRRTKRPKFGRRLRRRRLLPPLALPRSRVVRMRTVARLALTANGGALFQTYVKANSLNDPTVGYGQTLPLGLDQWASQYQKYIVLGSKCKVRFIPTTITGAGNVGLYLADNTTALTNSDHYKELPNSKVRVVTTQKDYTTVVMNYSGKRFWRINNIKDDSEQEAAFSTSPGDPTDLAYFHIFIQDMAGTNNLICDTQVEIEYIVLLTDPVTLAQSSL